MGCSDRKDRLTSTTLQTALVAAGAATGPAVEVGQNSIRTFQAVLTCTSGNCSGTVEWEVSNDGTNFILAATTTFSAAASPQTDGFVSDAPWLYVRSDVTAISGTGAILTTYLVQ
jgi:hypothetical protein